MKAHLVPLSEVAEFINGMAFKPSDWQSEGRRIIRIQNLSDPTKPYNRTNKVVDPKYIVSPGTILVSWSATLDVFEWTESDEAVLNQHIFKVVPFKEKVHLPYLKIILKSSIRSMMKHTHGSTMKHINRREFLETLVPLPPLSEQKRIAAILDKADEIRRKREKAIELTDSFLSSVFLEMFGDSEINPHNFQRGTIRDLVSEVKYGTSGKAGLLGRFEIIRMNNLTYSGDIDLSELKRIDIDSKDESKYLVRKGDLLFNRTNSKELVGKTAVYPFDEPRVIAGYLIRVRPNTNANTEYISGYLNSIHGKNTLRHMCKSIVGMANINAQELQDIPILRPPIELQNRYADLVGAVRALRRKLNNSLDEVELLKSSLSHRLFTDKADTVRGTAALMEVAHAL
jgi:type I restriction enzyme S subunit